LDADLDADLDAKDKHGIMGDLGVLRAGEILQLSSECLHGVKSEGSWTLQKVVFSSVFPGNCTVVIFLGSGLFFGYEM